MRELKAQYRGMQSAEQREVAIRQGGLVCLKVNIKRNVVEGQSL